MSVNTLMNRLNRQLERMQNNPKHQEGGGKRKKTKHKKTEHKKTKHKKTKHKKTKHKKTKHKKTKK